MTLLRALLARLRRFLASMYGYAGEYSDTTEHQKGKSDGKRA